ncbi:allophanate hydrolase [Amylibacter marinus]|uniref:Allophanate hydrolase n=1 Tax=Amylibacter marinus TaxID=1475483 RepID=A0ABQ5VU03_9RHOB|nr:5-oxoprolinase subunit PxpB [Amylibacter marinus]GLQ34698.1 allophanate hydrolase [Amylibacter marinus]
MTHQPQQSPEFPRLYPMGDSAFVVELGDAVDPGINQAVLGLELTLNHMSIHGLSEIVPSYRSLMILFDPLILPLETLTQKIHQALLQSPNTPLPRARHWTIPVCYGADHGEDITEVSTLLNITVPEIIAAHTNAEYRVYMIGFSPGYAYLGGLSPRLHIPRRQTPRPAVKPGAIGIAGQQACVFTNAAPTGWYILGATPIPAFEPARDPACLFRAGDQLRFAEISPDRYNNLVLDIQNGLDITAAFAAPAPANLGPI